MKSTIKKTFLYTIGILSIVGTIFGSQVLAEQIGCDDLHFSIDGAQKVVINQQYDYTMNVQRQTTTGLEIQTDDIILSGSINDFLKYVIQNSTVEYHLYRNNKWIQKISTSEFSYNFDKLAGYNIKAKISFNNCNYNVQKNIQVFNKSYIYVGSFLETFNFDIKHTIEGTDTLLHTYILSAESQKDQKTFSQQLSQQLVHLEHAKDIFFNVDNYGLLFELLQEFQTNKQLNLTGKNIFLISDENKTITKKFLAKFIKQSEIQSIYIINSQEFSNILFNLSIGKAPYEQSFLSINALDFDSYRLSYTLSHLLDYLVYHGFPLETLKLFLSIALAIVVIVFFKQVIGFSSFGVYYPLIFGFALHTVGLKTSIGMLLASFLAVVCIILLSRRVNILVTAKIGLMILLYTLFTLLGIAVYKMLNIPQNEFLIFTNPMIMITFITLLMVGRKLWNKAFPFKSLQRRKSIGRFAILSFITYSIISSDSIHNYLLIHPWILAASIVFTFLLGRFAGLQVMEYIRFAPLIRWLRKKHK